MRPISRVLGGAAAVALLAGCSPDAPTALRPGAASPGRAGYDQAGMHRQYGTPVKVGEGMARTYVVLDAKAGQAPVELGIALDEKALEGLPADMGGHGHAYLLALPEHAPAPYRFAELDWNPMGHDPLEAYGVPHFDFHFYTISREEHDAILPSDPNFAAKARNVPVGDSVPPYYVVPGDPAALAVPQMGVHWSDVRSPELQGLLGHPESYQPFTRTFIYGSWNGRFTFYEPMVTRAYLLSHPDDLAEISVPARYPQPGYYPTAYRVTYDPQAKEYRVALTGLVERR
jgi:hypothetical protein